MNDAPHFHKNTPQNYFAKIFPYSVKLPTGYLAKKGFGEWLSVDSLKKLLAASNFVAFPPVVDAKEGAIDFYKNLDLFHLWIHSINFI